MENRSADEDVTIFVVDDDPSMREALDGLMRSAGRKVKAFASAQDFLAAAAVRGPGCLVLDVELPGLSGLDLQARLAENEPDLPIVFITSHGDIPMTVRAMKAGAVEFLTKPFREQELLDGIDRALEKGTEARLRRRELDVVRERFETLTPREREVMALVASGLLNKQIAGKLGSSEITVKVQRRQVMLKMKAASLADRLKVLPPAEPQA